MNKILLVSTLVITLGSTTGHSTDHNNNIDQNTNMINNKDNTNNQSIQNNNTSPNNSQNMENSPHENMQSISNQNSSLIQSHNNIGEQYIEGEEQQNLNKSGIEQQNITQNISTVQSNDLSASAPNLPYDNFAQPHQNNAPMYQSQVVTNINNQNLQNNMNQSNINNNEVVNTIEKSNINIQNNNNNMQTQETNNKMSYSMQVPQNTLVNHSPQTHTANFQSQIIPAINSSNINDNIKKETNISNNENASIVQNNQSNIIMEQNENNLTRDDKKTNNNNILVNDSEFWEQLYPDAAKNMFYFDGANGITKDGKNEPIVVHRILTSEICNAIKNKDVNTLQDILCKNGERLETHRELAKHNISRMIENFNRWADLECVIQYLNTTGGKPHYKPVSSMKEWLESLPQETSKAIKDVAKPFLEENTENEPVLSYTLLASFEFAIGDKSKIDIPSSQNFALVNELKKKEIAINEQITKMQKEIEACGATLEQIKLLQELDDLKKNEDLTKFAKIEKHINEKKEEITTVKKNKEEAIEKYNNESKGKKEQLEKELENLKKEANALNKKIEEINSNRNLTKVKKELQKNQHSESLSKNEKEQQTKQEELAKLTKAEELTKQYDGQLNKLNEELSKLNNQKTELEKIYDPINKSIKEKEEALKTQKIPDKNRLSYITGLIEIFNDNISKILSEARGLFNIDWTNRNNQQINTVNTPINQSQNSIINTNASINSQIVSTSQMIDNNIK